EHHAGALAQRADGLDGAVQVRARLDVDPDDVGPGLGVALDVAVGVVDHQVHVERPGGHAAQGLDHGRPDGQVGHEVPVHHVHVDVVGAALVHGAHLLAQPG